MNGKVKFYKEDKKYGFIAGEDGSDYFFHCTALVEGEHTVVQKDQNVTFTPAKSPKGLQAQSITLV